MMDIVALSGKAGSGKTSIKTELERQYKLLKYDNFAYFKYADALYEIHDIILNNMERITGIPRVKKDRVLLQLLGTDWGRKVFGQNVWVNILLKRMAEYELKMVNARVLCVLDDMRFPNEFHGMSEGLRVHLEAPEDVRRARADQFPENTLHESETALDEIASLGWFDLNLDTAGDDLNKCVNLILAQLQKNSWKEKRKDGSFQHKKIEAGGNGMSGAANQ